MKASLCLGALAFVLAFTISTGLILADRTGIRGPVFVPALSEICLGCICEATTNCNLTIGCWRGRCGPLFISRDYWIEAGRPVLPGDHPSSTRSYVACVNDAACAATAAKRYVARHAQDCNNDGILDCDDYARIHYLGGRQCYLPIEHYGYYKVFRFCVESVFWLNG